MAQVLVDEASLQDIASAIREKTGGTETYIPSAMGAAIRALETGGGAKIASGSGTTTKISYTNSSGKTSTAYALCIDLESLDFVPAMVIWGNGNLRVPSGITYFLNSAIIDYDSKSLIGCFCGSDTSSSGYTPPALIASSQLSNNVLCLVGNYSSASTVNYCIAGG